MSTLLIWLYYVYGYFVVCLAISDKEDTKRQSVLVLLPKCLSRDVQQVFPDKQSTTIDKWLCSFTSHKCKLDLIKAHQFLPDSASLWRPHASTALTTATWPRTWPAASTASRTWRRACTWPPKTSWRPLRRTWRRSLPSCKTFLVNKTTIWAEF